MECHILPHKCQIELYTYYDYFYLGMWSSTRIFVENFSIEILDGT